MKRFVQFFCLFLLAGPVLAAGRLADVEIYDRAGGRTLPIYESGGHWFVAGRPGKEYQVTIRNRESGDLLAVVSVDGVIGVALFRRKSEPLAELEQPKARGEAGVANDSAQRSAAPPAAEKKIGTGHGRSQNAPARYVEFERESDRPAEVVAIHYDTYANLVARGVIREERKLPSPFPGGFVPDPPERG